MNCIFKSEATDVRTKRKHAAFAGTIDRIPTVGRYDSGLYLLTS